MAIKILIGGSPCTYWSIAKNNGRETKAEGMGWELFKNYLIAKEKFKPDFFLYENNKSAAQAIKDQIAEEFGVGVDPDVRFTYINSALVSAQNRQRFYVTNFGDIEQPEDRGILLKDILETGQRLMCCDSATKRKDTNVEHLMRPYGSSAKTGLYAVPVCHNIPQDVRVRKYTCNINKFQDCLRGHKHLTNREIAETLRKPLTEVEHWFRKDKCFNIPDPDIWFELKKLLNIETTEYDDFVTVFEERKGVFEKSDRCYDVNGKMSTLMTGKTDNIIVPVPVNTTVNDKSYALTSSYYKCGENPCSEFGEEKRRPRIAEPIGYAIPCEWDENGNPTKAISCADGKTYTVYEVKDGQITIKGKQYPIKLTDGYYIIRKLTVRECARLQTMPDDYCKAVSDSQAYKALGNGWTAEVIIHLLNHALKDVPRDEEIVVLSMYDGIATGRYCLDKMGFTNVTYHAYEIDKYPIQVAMDNYPEIIQHGDAFAVREDDWKAPQTRSEWLDDLLGA